MPDQTPEGQGTTKTTGREESGDVKAPLGSGLWPTHLAAQRLRAKRSMKEWRVYLQTMAKNFEDILNRLAKYAGETGLRFTVSWMQSETKEPKRGEETE